MRRPGVRIVAKALEEPIRQIAANAGLDGSVILEKVRTSGKNGYGFDAYKEEYCDMIAGGIVDPAKVTRSALENAASVSGMVLTTESLVAEKPAAPARTPAPATWPAAWAVCINRHRKALKLLDFLSVQKRIYAKLTPRIQAHYRVTEIGTCLKSRCRFFLIYASAFNCRSCGTMSTTEITNAIQSAMGVTHAIPETPTAWFRISMNTTSRLPLRRRDRQSGCTFLPIA